MILCCKEVSFMKLSSLILLYSILTGPARPAAADSPADLRLTLPAEFYAVAGQELSVYFDNVVLRG